MGTRFVWVRPDTLGSNSGPGIAQENHAGGQPSTTQPSASTHQHHNFPRSNGKLPGQHPASSRPLSQPSAMPSGVQAKPTHPAVHQRPAGAPAGPRTQQSAQDADAPAAKKQKLGIDNTAANIQSKLEEKQKEMEELRRKLQTKEQLLKQQQEQMQAREAAKQQQQQQQAEAQRRKAQLSKGFSAFAGAAGTSAAPGAAASGTDGSATAASRPASSAPAVADVAEVARVLDAKNDYACLKLHFGANMSQVRKSYRQLAMALHPDKCSVEGAAAAFQRVNAAYNNLSKHGG